MVYVYDILFRILSYVWFQVAFYEILNGLWVRNGLQIKGQAMTYIQCNFCNSMVDADLYLLQVCSTRVPPDTFLETLIDKFNVRSCLSLAPAGGSNQTSAQVGDERPAAGEGGNSSAASGTTQPMLDSLLTFLATLLAVRTNLGLSDLELNRLEMVTLLCMGDKTHSQLMELMPERCGTSQSRDFEQLLASVADYRAPNLEASGNMQQGMYAPKPEVWRSRYDPLHVLLRSVHRRDFQTSMDRYTDYARQSGRLRAGSGGAPWPPFRRPAPCSKAYTDPRVLLRSRVFHAAALAVLLRAARGNASEQATALVVHLLDLAVEQEAADTGAAVAGGGTVRPAETSDSSAGRTVPDHDLRQWYVGDCLSVNLRAVIGRTVVRPEPPDRSPITYSSDSDVEWGDTDTSDDSESTAVQTTASSSGPRTAQLALEHLGNEVALRTVRPEEETMRELPALPSSTITMEVALPIDLEDEDEAVVPALPPTVQLPAVLAGNEVGRTRPTQRHRQRQHQSTSTEVVPSVRQQHHGPRRRQNTATPLPSTQHQQSETKLPVNESIISLLLKLHSQLSGVPDSYDPDEQQEPKPRSPLATEEEEDCDDRCGDGPYHVARLLRRVAELDPACAEHIRECRRRLWPPRPDAEREQKRRESAEREERRRRAKERQQRLMEEFANRQRQFLETMETEEQQHTGMDWQDDAGESSTTSESTAAAPPCQEYDCVICSQTTASTEDKPMGLVVLVQATSVLGHRRRRPGGSGEHSAAEDSRAPLPTCDEERSELWRDVTHASEFGKRVEELDRHFDRYTHNSWLLACNIGWEGGVHVQTCGHHLHLDCLKAYLESLRTQQRLQSLAVDKGEYFCPLCRQLANSVLPLSPQLGGERAAVVRSRQAPGSTPQQLDPLAVRELRDMMRDARREPPGSQLGQAIGKAMEDMTSSTHIKFKTMSGQPSHQSLFLFVTSIARTNLEVELVQRGGTLVTTAVTDQPQQSSTSSSTASNVQALLTPKRDCLVPLLHVLAVHARLLAQWPYWATWQQLSSVDDYERLEDVSVSQPTPVTTVASASLAVLAGGGASFSASSTPPGHWDDCSVPLLYRDPTALLVQFTLLLPLHIDQTYYATVVKALYNLLYYQAVAQLTCAMSVEERAEIGSGSTNGEIRTLADALRLVAGVIGRTDLYAEDPAEECANAVSLTASTLNMHALEQRLQQLCLPFLRCAALLRHHLYGQPLPDVRSAECEFVRLVYYLELVTEGMDWGRFSAARALSWPEPTGSRLPHTWCEQLARFAGRSQIAARSLLVEQHAAWRQPRLLRLPREYERIFTYYHERQCAQCHSVPQETSVCLLCGRVVCLKQACCKQGNMCEAVAHALDCGAGTGLFLVVTSTYVIVIRGRRACLWGSLYLDDFEEEDRDLKRGKPLYLSRDRFQLLEQQWLAHRFDHTKKTWVWHRDAL